jgi:hypothetical protein
MVIEGQPYDLPFDAICDGQAFETKLVPDFRVLIKVTASSDPKLWNAFDVENGERYRIEATDYCRVWPRAKLKLNGD